jgi:hypothetical protein
MAVPAIPKPPRWTPGTNPRTVEDESVRITPEPRKIMCRRPGGKEMCRSAGQDRTHEVLARHLYERDQLYVPDRDGVEGDMDAPGTRGHSVSMFVDRRLVERIDLCRLGHSSRRGDLSCHLVELCEGTAARNTLAPSLAKARATALPMAPPAP